MAQEKSMEPQIDLDGLLQNIAYWLEHSNSDVTWPFVKRGLNHIVGDLRQNLELRSDRPAIEAATRKLRNSLSVESGNECEGSPLAARPLLAEDLALLDCARRYWVILELLHADRWE